jgi:hypothetical protein
MTIREHVDRVNEVTWSKVQAKEAESAFLEWLAVLAHCFRLLDGLAVLELDRVLGSSPDDLNQHRLGLKAARQNRLDLISQCTGQLMVRMRTAGAMHGGERRDRGGGQRWRVLTALTGSCRQGCGRTGWSPRYRPALAPAHDLAVSLRPGRPPLRAAARRIRGWTGRGSRRTPSSSRRLVGHMVQSHRRNNVAKRCILLKGVIVFQMSVISASTS